MKRPKLPQLRIAKKYRDGKLMTAVVAAFEASQKKALSLQNPAERFEALARLENKITKQFNHAAKGIYEVTKRQTFYGAMGGAGLGLGLLATSMMVAPPLAPFFMLGGAAVGLGGQLGALTRQDVIVSRAAKSKNLKNPLAAMNRLQQLQQETNRALVALAKQHPLELVEKPRFQTLSEQKPEIATALTRAFIMAKSEKPPAQPAEISDQAKALPKPRIPTPPKK